MNRLVAGIELPYGEVMDARRLYDDDFYAWSEQQAAVLRRLGDAPSRIPNDLDVQHVAEEIEDLGRNQKDSVESFIRLILVHLLKLTAAPYGSAVDHWRGEIVTFHIEMLSKATPAMWSRIDVHRLWRLAKRQARANLRPEEESDPASRIWNVGSCPLDLPAFKEEEFDLEAALARCSVAAEKAG